MVSENVKNDEEKKKKGKKKKSRQNTRVPVAGLLLAKLFHSASIHVNDRFGTH